MLGFTSGPVMWWLSGDGGVESCKMFYYIVFDVVVIFLTIAAYFLIITKVKERTRR